MILREGIEARRRNISSNKSQNLSTFLEGFCAAGKVCMQRQHQFSGASLFALHCNFPKECKMRQNLQTALTLQKKYEYRNRLKSLFVVGRIFFLFLLNCSAWHQKVESCVTVFACQIM